MLKAVESENMKANTLLTTGEVALEAGVSAQTVRLWEAANRLPCERTERGQRLFRRRDVDRWLARRKAEAESLRVVGA